MKIVMQKNKSVDRAFYEFIIIKQGENIAQATIEAYENMFGYFMDYYGKNNPVNRYQS